MTPLAPSMTLVYDPLAMTPGVAPIARNNGRANHPLVGMNSRAETITFWARSRGKNNNNQLIFFLHDDSGMSKNELAEVGGLAADRTVC